MSRTARSVRTAVLPLPAAALDALKDTLTRAYGHVTCMTTVRPELIGGVCLRIGDTHYDGTLRHALDLLAQAAPVRGGPEENVHRWWLC